MTWIVIGDVASLPAKIIGACLAGLLIGVFSGRLRIDITVAVPYLVACIAATVWLHQMLRVDPGAIAILLGFCIGFVIFIAAPSRKRSIAVAAVVTVFAIAGCTYAIFVQMPPAEVRDAVARIQRAGGFVGQSDNPGTTYLDQWMVDFEGSNLDDDRLLGLTADLAKFPKLWLKLSGCRVGDRGVEALSQCRSLTDLNLDGTQVTDMGLAQLATVKQLSVLNLSRTQITDNGVKHLGGMASLRTFVLRESHVSAEGVKQLQESLPNCKVYWDPSTPDKRQRPAAPDQRR